MGSGGDGDGNSELRHGVCIEMADCAVCVPVLDFERSRVKGPKDAVWKRDTCRATSNENCY